MTRFSGLFSNMLKLYLAMKQSQECPKFNLTRRCFLLQKVVIDREMWNVEIATRFVPQQSRVPNSMWEWGVYLGSKYSASLSLQSSWFWSIMIMIMVITLWLMFRPPGCSCLSAGGRRWASCWKTRWSSPLTDQCNNNNNNNNNNKQTW